MNHQTLPLVSIITPSFNQGQFLEQTMYSVFKQDYPNIEYIVIDGGSTDQSLNIILQYADRLTYWVSEPDCGQANGINKGLHQAKGEIIGWLNSDDVLLPDTISRVIRQFEENPEIDVIYGRLERIDSEGEHIPTPKLPKDHLVFNKKLIIGECIVNQPGSFWRRGIMERVGHLNEELHFALDYEYWIRMALAGANFKRIAEPVARFRISSKSKTVNQTAEMAKEQLRVLEFYLSQPNLREHTGLSEKQFQNQSRKTISVICLHAFYGSLKRGLRQEALKWLIRGVTNDPLVILQRRWLNLLQARLSRNQKK